MYSTAAQPDAAPRTVSRGMRLLDPVALVAGARRALALFPGGVPSVQVPATGDGGIDVAEALRLVAEAVPDGCPRLPIEESALHPMVDDSGRAGSHGVGSSDGTGPGPGTGPGTGTGGRIESDGEDESADAKKKKKSKKAKREAAETKRGGKVEARDDEAGDAVDDTSTGRQRRRRRKDKKRTGDAGPADDDREDATASGRKRVSSSPTTTTRAPPLSPTPPAFRPTGERKGPQRHVVVAKASGGKGNNGAGGSRNQTDRAAVAPPAAGRNRSLIPLPPLEVDPFARASVKEGDVIRNPMRRRSLPRSGTMIPMLDFSSFKRQWARDGGPLAPIKISPRTDRQSHGGDGETTQQGSVDALDPESSTPAKKNRPKGGSRSVGDASGRNHLSPLPPTRGKGTARDEHHRRERTRQGTTSSHAGVRLQPITGGDASPTSNKGGARSPRTKVARGGKGNADSPSTPSATARTTTTAKASAASASTSSPASPASPASPSTATPRRRAVLPRTEAVQRINAERREKLDRAKKAREYAEHLRKRALARQAGNATPSKSLSNRDGNKTPQTRESMSAATATSTASEINSDLGSKQDVYEEQLEKLMDIQAQFA